MVYDTKEQLVGAIRGSSCFGIQLDETTDVAGIAQMTVFCTRYFQYEMFENILFCKTLKTSTKVEDILKLLDFVLPEYQLE
jgi:hypothetical protein